MPNLVGSIKKKYRRLLCAAFLIAIGMIFCFFPQSLNHVQKKIEPTSSQSGTIEVIRVVEAKITCEQEQISWVNWTVLMGKGFSFEIHQNSSGKGIFLNFGTVPNDIFLLSCLLNTSHTGTFIVSLVIWNATTRATDEIQLTIQPSIGLTLRYTFLGVIGSVAVATNFTAAIYWRKQRSATQGRNLKRDWVFPVEFTKVDTKENQFADQIYISSTNLVQMMFIQDNSLRILSVENYKEFEDSKVLQDIAVQFLSNRLNRGNVKTNQSLSLPDLFFFLNYLRFEDKNLAVAAISSKSLHPSFISALRSTIENLLSTSNSASIDFTELRQKINLILHLNRSRDYQIPLQTKTEILQKTTQWKTPLEEKEVITPVEMAQVQRDLEDMSLDEIQEMVKFLGNGKKILEKSKEELDDVAGS